MEAAALEQTLREHPDDMGAWLVYGDWNSGGSPDNYIDVAAQVGVLHLLVPPILFTEAAGCYHLQFDFFRNSWMVKHREAMVPVPMIRNLNVDPDDLDADELRPWMDAVDPTLVKRRSGGKARTLWWAEASELIDELYDAIEPRESADDDDED